MSEKRKNPVASWWDNLNDFWQAFIVGLMCLVIFAAIVILPLVLNQIGIDHYQLTTPCIEQARIKQIDELNAACIIELGLQDAYQRGEPK